MWKKIKPYLLGALAGLCLALGISRTRRNRDRYSTVAHRYDNGANAGSRVAEDYLWDSLGDHLDRAVRAAEELARESGGNR